MSFKKLEVPTVSITDVKKSPSEIFRLAEAKGTGVYVFNREKIAGVMISQKQYEELVGKLNGQLETVKKLNSEIDGQEKEEKTVKSLEAKQVFKQFSNRSFGLRELDDALVLLGFITKKSSYGGINLIEEELLNTGQLIYRNRSNSQYLTIFLVKEADTSYRLVEVS
ncbi:MAG: type II toxin-antitoxin system Phd/YefM family antitoxin [Streptococcaceae bacterium]|jgi:hypothetical protein|nr:type II toxin-antitoxin system Phd/YefM family antitoxin [Streptococcaceae bacterium]